VSKLGWLCLGILSLILSACSGAQTPAAYFVPPTSGSQVSFPSGLTPTGSTSDQPATPTSPSPTTAPACAPNLLYLEDLTVPDGTVVAPGERLDKRWRVENNGSCNWDVKYSLVLIAGQQLGAPKQQAIFPARSGTPATVRIIFTAPQEPGAYRSAWQAQDPQGELFGDPIYIDIIVQSP
jgi:hypothetical protein